MKIIVNKQNTISELNSSFQNQFPNLKLVFFSQGPTQANDASHRVTDLYTSLVALFPEMHETEIPIGEASRPAELERAFAMAHLSVQVFRRMGKIWLETTTTDSKSLYALNKLSADNDLEPDSETIDYQEHE